ncbi:MAG TPA: tetratricopeptide repeat protein [Isosphaeraceae bacterium]|nr:tetratricopeptide repeat protein [Isosphaeraceae bacterium]
MNMSEFYYNVVDYPSWVGLNWAMYAAAGLVVVAAILLIIGKFRWFARALGLVALVVMMGVLYDIQGQTVRLVSFGGHARHIMPRYSVATRIWARCAMVAIPAVAIAIMTGAWETARRTMRSQVPRQLKTGRQHFLRKEYDAALGEYNRATHVAPELAEAYWGRGCVHHAKGDHASALADFHKAIECDPRFARAYLERAKIRAELGDFDAALSDFGQLAVLQGNDPGLYLSRGVCFMKKGQHQEAAADFRKVLKLTNHSDFAEPAKSYLHQCESQTFPSTQPAPNPNGSPSEFPVRKPSRYDS